MADPLFDIAGRCIVVTGAASGLGRAIAGELGRRGARLVLADIDEARLEAVRAEMGGGALTQVADVTRSGDCAALTRAAVDRFGALDGVVNSVGIFRIGPALELEEADFRASLEANVTGAFLLSRAAAAVMGPNGGRIVHLASVSSLVANRNYAAYATSKAALAQLTRVLAREWAERSITVNGIGPAMTDTPLSGDHLAGEEFRKAALSVIPMGRFGRPEDLFATVVLLLAPGGAFITGQTIYVDGGRTLV